MLPCCRVPRAARRAPCDALTQTDPRRAFGSLDLDVVWAPRGHLVRMETKADEGGGGGGEDAPQAGYGVVIYPNGTAVPFGLGTFTAAATAAGQTTSADVSGKLLENIQRVLATCVKGRDAVYAVDLHVSVFDTLRSAAAVDVEDLADDIMCSLLAADDVPMLLAEDAEAIKLNASQFAAALGFEVYGCILAVPMVSVPPESDDDDDDDASPVMADVDMGVMSLEAAQAMVERLETATAFKVDGAAGRTVHAVPLETM